MAIKVTMDDIHEHLESRMSQRGVRKEEVEYVLNNGWEALDAKPGTQGKTAVFAHRAEWEGRWYEEKEVSVYYKMIDGLLVLLTVKARYGSAFPRREQE